MISILKEYCNKKPGLLLFDPPTGSGKTHNVLQWIYENYKIHCVEGRKIFFITNLKKNLPYEELRDNFFSPDNKLEDFDKNVMFLDSNSDCLINNFKEIDNSINDYFKNQAIYYKIKGVVNQIHKYQKKIGFSDFVTSLKDDLRTNYEPDFRRKIENFLKENYRNRQERIKAIQKNENLQWIGKLYPAVFTSKKKIFFLSIDKFYHKNSTLVEPSYSFLENDITKNAVIFIDEFDATKDNILKNIIEKGKNQRIDFIHLFTEIYWALKNNVFPQKFTTHSEKREKLIEKGYSLKLDDIQERLLKMAEEIENDYKTNFSFKTLDINEEILNQRNLLFHDFQYHSVYRNDKKYIRLNENRFKKINEVIFEKDKPEGKNIVSLLNQIKGFVQYFSGIIKSIAENYQQIEMQDRLDNPNRAEFTFDSALSTVIEEFGLEPKYKNFLIDTILSEREKPKRKDNGKYQLNYDLSVYQQGFRYYDFVDDDSHQSKTKIFIYSFQNTPEKFILKLSEKAKIIGISATSRIQTVTGNYDISYFKRQLGEGFIELTEKERKNLNSLFYSQSKYYNKIKIHPKWVDISDCEQEFKNLLEDEELSKAIINEIKSNNPKINDYLLRRYIKIGTVYKEFLLKDDIKGFLCLLNKEPKEYDTSLNLKFLEKIFSILVEDVTNTKELFIIKDEKGEDKYDIKNSFKIINSSDFDNKKQSFITKLENGRKLFIISMYQTMGAGQNLQFIAPNPENLINVRDENLFDWNKENKTDFNAIYLDKPTHLIQKIDKNLNEEGFIRYLFQLEFLAQSGIISVKQLNSQVTAAFKFLLASFNTKKEIDSVNNGFLYQDSNIKQHFAKYIIQAIGRICRTNLKSSNIYIYADIELDSLICDFDVENNLVLNEFKALVNSSKKKKKSKNSSLQQFKNLADSTNRKINSHIRKFISNEWGWKEKKMEEWEALRQLCLRYPTLTKDNIQEKNLYRFLDLYIELPNEANQYSYNQKEDYADIIIEFDDSLPFKVSEDSARLKELLQIPSVEKYFKKEHWATSFKGGNYILPPELFNNIYKGALGEVVGKFIFEHHLDITLEELPLEHYELFDYKMSDSNIFIDFKHWKESTKISHKEQEQKIRYKMETVKADKVFIINILSSSTTDLIKSTDGKIIEIPYLWNSNTNTFNTQFIKEITTNEVL